MANILIIDDESEVRYAIRAVLEDIGHTVAEAGTGTEGLERFQDGTYDLVICDIIMPDKEGIETIVEIRQIEPDQRIVAISGGGRIKKEDYLAVAAAVGATHTISKPFDAETLTEMVTRILHNGKERQALA
jgi:CheY-like chemotaxis protein